jgi:hypothetical protein
MDMKAFVYQIANTLTGQRYIGSSNFLPLRRWNQHLRTLKRGVHSSSRFQKLFDSQSQDVTLWEFKVVASMDVTTVKELRRLEADWILKVPSELRLNMPNQTTTTRERHAEVVRLLATGARYVTIRDKVGISLGMISSIKQNLEL